MKRITDIYKEKTDRNELNKTNLMIGLCRKRNSEGMSVDILFFHTHDHTPCQQSFNLKFGRNIIKINCLDDNTSNLAFTETTRYKILSSKPQNP